MTQQTCVQLKPWILFVHCYLELEFKNNSLSCCANTRCLCKLKHSFMGRIIQKIKSKSSFSILWPLNSCAWSHFPAIWGLNHMGIYDNSNQEKIKNETGEKKVKIELRANQQPINWTFHSFESWLILTGNLSKRLVFEGVGDKNHFSCSPTGPTYC